MTILFYIFVSLCLVIVKTTLIPGMAFFDKFYDLLIPIVIYLSLFRSLREGIPIVLFFGLIMDSLCGGPMGLYMATYIWLYVALRYLRQVLHAGNIVLFAVAVAGGVAFESIILLIYMLLLAPDAIVPADATKTTMMQIIWAFLTGPILMVMISWAQKQIDIWREKLFPDWLDSNGT
jgi:cell shape-determining protein MreD